MLYCIEGKYETEEEGKEEKEEDPIFGRHGVAHRQTSYWSAACSPENAIAVHEDTYFFKKWLKREHKKFWVRYNQFGRPASALLPKFWSVEVPFLCFFMRVFILFDLLLLMRICVLLFSWRLCIFPWLIGLIWCHFLLMKLQHVAARCCLYPLVESTAEVYLIVLEEGLGIFPRQRHF